MARVLCVWEQGSNLGHLSHLKRPIQLALEAGHSVVLAARELRQAKEVLGDLPITYLQAPFKQNVVPADHSQFLSYTHLLQRQCFSNPDELEMLVRAWRGIFDLAQPDLVMYEHSPTALVASRGYAFKRVHVGTGFTVPPLRPDMLDPFLPFVTTQRNAQVDARLRSDDAHLLQVLNTAMVALGVAPMGRLADIYAEVDAQFLFARPQLDHFGLRSGQDYLGVEPMVSPHPPLWPPGSGPRVFGYLQCMPALECLLRDLQQAGVCALLYVRDLPESLRLRYTSAHLNFADAPVNLQQVASQVDWVISHANLTTTTTFMLHGIPQLLIPRHQEQLFAALRMVGHGSAVMAFQDQASYTQDFATMMAKVDLRVKARLVQDHCQKTPVRDRDSYIRDTFRALLGNKSRSLASKC